MKTKILLFVLFTIFFVNIRAQDLGINYNSTGAGSNFTLYYSHLLKNNDEIGVGIGYNLEAITYFDDQYNVYSKKLYSTQSYQRINFNFFYHKTIFKNLNHVKFFVFYDLQVKYSDLKNIVRIDRGKDTSGYFPEWINNTLFLEYELIDGPFWWIENNFGIGFKVNIYKGLSVNQKIGGGVMLIIGNGDNTNLKSIVKPMVEWQLCGLYSTGISYNFAYKKNKGK